MGLIVSQCLTVTGPAADVRDLADLLLERDGTGEPVGIAFEHAAPAPDSFASAQDADAWRSETWGDARPELDDFSAKVGKSGKLTARFHTRGMTISPLVKSLGARFPTLTFRLAGKVDSDEVAFVHQSSKGRYTERDVELTDRFTREVDGAAAVAADRAREVAFYSSTSKICKAPPTRLLKQPARIRLQRALVDYPVYEPPFTGLLKHMPRPSAHQNFQHFLDTCAERLDGLQSFLKIFGVDLATTDTGLAALDRWFATYGGFLCVPETGAAFYTHMPAWRGPWAVYNVLHDLSIALGDAAIERFSGFAWRMNKASRGHEDPYIVGPEGKARGAFYPIYELNSASRALQYEDRAWGRQSSVFDNEISKRLKTHFTTTLRQHGEWLMEVQAHDGLL